MTHSRQSIAGAGVTLVAVLLVGILVLPGELRQRRHHSPFDGVRLYVDRGGQAAVAAQSLTRRRPSVAPTLARIAAVPQAVWLGDWVDAGAVTARVNETVEDAARTGTTPLFVVYNIPRRDCGQHSAGGASDSEAYRSWILAFAAGIDRARAFVVLEPDALAQLDCLTAEHRAERLRLLRFAARVLSSYPDVVTYLDAGHDGWIPAPTMGRRLRSAGVAHTRGFALNVSFYDTTDNEIRYGRAITRILGGKSFVIDTSRNGNGPVPGRDSWCNPAGRALGALPLTPVGEAPVDAVLWIKTPGVSDGECSRGEPPAGKFWVTRALELAAAAGW